MSDMDGIREILNMMTCLPGIDKNGRGYKCIRVVAASTRLRDFEMLCLKVADPYSDYTDAEVEALGDYVSLIASGIESFLAANPAYEDESKWHEDMK